MSENSNIIQHHGTKGMRWGIRRYQNKDGSLTTAGRRREARLDNKLANQRRKYSLTKSKKLTKDDPNDIHIRKDHKKMSDAELREVTNRLNLENNYINAINNYKNLNPKPISRAKKFISKFSHDVLVAGTVEVSKDMVKGLIKDAVKKK